MNSPSPETTDNSKPQSSSLSELGQIIRSRTTDLIAIAIVIILGLTVGKQLIQWWQVSKSDIIQNPSQQALQVNDWNQPESPTSINFGNQEIIREQFHGTESVVKEKILNRCLTYLQSCTLPSVSAESTSKSAKWRDHLSKLAPLKSDPQGHAIFEINGPFPLIIGVLGYKPDQKLEHSHIACMASYAQFGPEIWLLTLSKAQHAVSSNSNSSLQFIPPQCEISLALNNQSGNSIIQFTGKLTPEECWTFYNKWAIDSHMIQQNLHIPSEQPELSRVYSTAPEFIKNHPLENNQQQDLTADSPVLKPVPEADFSPQNPQPLKVIIQIREVQGKLHGIIHTFPLSN